MVETRTVLSLDSSLPGFPDEDQDIERLIAHGENDLAWARELEFIEVTEGVRGCKWKMTGHRDEECSQGRIKLGKNSEMIGLSGQF